MNNAYDEADQLIESLGLIRHPEGGWYREVYRADTTVIHPHDAKERSAATSIYYLLKHPDFSSFHRLGSDEVWHFYQGGAILIHELTELGLKSTRLSNENIVGSLCQYVVKRDLWFAVELAGPTSFALVGCIMAPGFDFDDFELAKRDQLLQVFPEQAAIVHRLCRH